MPLVVPGVTVAATDKIEEWTHKLVGKKLTNDPSSATVFCKADLPENTRIIQPGQMVTKDHRLDRMNVHLNEEGDVSHVTHG